MLFNNINLASMLEPTSNINENWFKFEKMGFWFEVWVSPKTQRRNYRLL